jgi:hypothetical protein
MFEPLKYLTPYIMDADTYFEWGVRKVRPVYCQEIEEGGSSAEVAMFNEDLTEIENSVAWVHPMKDTPEKREFVQGLLDEMWGETENGLMVVNLTCDDIWYIEDEEEGQAIIDEQCERHGGALYTPDDFAIMTVSEYHEYLNNNELIDLVCND